jgi:hypothetical protein
MGRHQTASSSARARIVLGALPLVATVGAIGVGSVVMSPTAAEAPLERPGGGAGAVAPPASAALPGAPVTVLGLASTGVPVAVDPIVPGRTAGAAPTGRGDAEAAPRRSVRAGAAGGGTVARATAARDADTPARGSSGGGGGGTADREDTSGGSSGSGGSGGSESSGSGGTGSPGGGRGGGGGLLGGVVGGLGQTVSGATSLLSFG